MIRNTLSKDERLRGEGRIGALFTGGRRGTVGPVKFCWLAIAAVDSADTEDITAETAVQNRGQEAEERGRLPEVLRDGIATVAAGAREVMTEEQAVIETVAPNVEMAGVAVLFSVPKKIFKRAWKRNLLKRRMRESYRTRKHKLIAAAVTAGVHIDIALICGPLVANKDQVTDNKANRSTNTIPDFKSIDDAIARILDKILAKIPARG